MSAALSLIHLRRVDVVLSHHDARRVQRPVDFIGQAAFKGSDGIKQPPQIPHLHEAVLSCCHQQVTETRKEKNSDGTDEKRLFRL